jgi:hypothetical protein
MKQVMAGVVGVLIGLALPAGARADYMNWSYHWALSDGPTFPSGFSNIAFALHPGANTGASTIPVGNFSSNSVATSPDSFNANYALTLTITDNATHDHGNLTFHGLLSGSVGSSSSNATNVFSDPNQNLTLDGHVYHVSVDSTTGVAGPADGIAAIGANVSVTNLSGSGSGSGSGSSSNSNSGSGLGDGLTSTTQGSRDPGVPRAPEPSTLLLAGLGLTLCGVPCWRRRTARLTQ